jgi:hypothetical protein
VKAFFHDASAYPEPDGFWVRGESTTSLTVLKPRAHDAGVALEIHSGLRSNRATVSSGRWTEQIDLVPGTAVTIQIPSAEGQRLVRLSITSRDGFVPAETDRASRDRRALGIWVGFPLETP